MTRATRSPRISGPGAPARDRNKKPVPLPERLGEPSVFKHVFYIIKENRTYDQIFGALPQGNGDPSPGAVRPRGHAEPARARRAIRAVRQSL